MAFSLRALLIPLFSSFLLFFLPITLLAQETELYEGTFSLKGGVKGQGLYDYYVKDGDSVKDGDFRFHTSDREGGDGGPYYGMKLSGDHDEGRMDGDWEYVHQRLLPTGEGYIQGRRIVHDSKGKEYKISASFENEKADGTWTAIHYTVEGSEPLDTLFRSRNRFDEGDLRGPFRAHSKRRVAEGDFTEEGTLKNEWRVQHLQDDEDTLAEVRDYENGVLKEHYILQNGDTIELKGLSWGDEGGEREEVPMDAKYMKALLHSNSLNMGQKEEGVNPEELIENSNRFLERSLYAFSSFNGQEVWQLLEGNEELPLPKVRVRVFPYSADEKEELERIAELLERNEELFQEHYENPQVDVGRHSNEEVSFLYEVLDRYKQGNEELKKTHELLSDSSFLYIDRDAVRGKLIPRVSYPDSLAFEFDGEEMRRPYEFPSGIPDSEEGLDSVRTHLKAIQEDLERIGKELDRILEKFKKEDLLAEKEGELVKRRDSLEGLYSEGNGKDTLNSYQKQLAPTIREFYKERFESYAELGLEEKIERVDELITCYGEGIELYHGLEELPEEVKKLDERYTRSTWNPIHFTNMDERVKKDLYEAFEEELMPYLVEDLKSSLECGKIKSKGSNFGVLLQRMIDLRTQETKVLEKRIKKADDPEEIISIMDLGVDID